MLIFSWLKNKLICSGDIPPNLGLNMILGKIRKTRVLRKQHPIFTLILQKSYRKRSDLQELVHKGGYNTIYGVSHTWFNNSNDHNLRTMDIEQLTAFRRDRSTDGKRRSSGVMTKRRRSSGVRILIPKTLNPKLRKDLSFYNDKLTSFYVLRQKRFCYK